MTRAEHLEWAKNRALELIENGDIAGAYASFTSDMNKHEELKDHSALTLGIMLMAFGHLNTAAQMKEFIEGFN